MSRPAAAAGQHRVAARVERVAADGERDAFAALFAHFAPRLKSDDLRQGVTADAADELVFWNACWCRGTAPVATIRARRR